MADKSLKSVKSRIICKKKEVKQATESGIILTGGSSDEDQWAEVTYVGVALTGPSSTQYIALTANLTNKPFDIP